jgi:LacI family transcriptional regulator
MVTINEIAATVGVSSATVSRVLNFDQTLSVTPQTRQAIIETAEALNYATPRNRNRGRAEAAAGPRKLALVHFLRPDQELADPYYVSLRLGIESRAAALRLETVKIYHGDALPDPATLASVAGVIAIGAHRPDEVAWLKHHARALVFADFVPPDDAVDAVHADLGLAMQKLLTALAEAGYRRIGFVGWRAEEGAAGDARAQAYADWMQAKGWHDPRLCAFDRNTEDSGYRLTRQIFSAGGRPDVLVTGNDNMAVGAYRALHEAGLRIPEDLALASFNDISVAQFLNPPLSTVHLPAEEIGETAVDQLVELMAGRKLAKRVILASRMIWRGSARGPDGA